MENIKKNFYELQAWEAGTLIIGVDEVGRGCLAGPVVAAATMIHKGKKSPLIKDSKILTLEERIKAFQWVIKNSTYGIGIVHNRLVDQKNIYQATKIAMKRAISQLLANTPIIPSAIVIDAVKLSLDNFQGPIHSFPFGESKSISIAAASIIAKVTRDRLMQEFEHDFPQYQLAQHKGYATVSHRNHLKMHKICLIHRVSFVDHWEDALSAQNTIPFKQSSEKELS